MDDYGRLSDAITRWDSGSTVWTIEMGGLGPGYEQAIQIGVFEATKRLQDVTLSEDKDTLNKTLDDNLRAVIAAVRPTLDGLSGAQAGAINNLVYHFTKFGYTETLNKVEKERLIQVSRNFPAFA